MSYLPSHEQSYQTEPAVSNFGCCISNGSLFRVFMHSPVKWFRKRVGVSFGLGFVGSVKVFVHFKNIGFKTAYFVT